ncbi:MAG: hypothetical protein JO199_07910 [Candidatus Eremiobacteraeota bacterium]|nr:hypothetical protein [Candidatus Eremiobacteraeota bacterium]
MHFEIDAPSNDVITMNLTIAALDRWLANGAQPQSGEEVGREIGAMYREIHAVVDEISPDEETEDEEEDDEEALVAH